MNKLQGSLSMCVKYKYPEMSDSVMYAIGKPEMMEDITDDSSVEILWVVLCDRTTEMQEEADMLKEEYVWMYIAEIFEKNQLHTRN